MGKMEALRLGGLLPRHDPVACRRRDGSHVNRTSAVAREVAGAGGSSGGCPVSSLLQRF
jgi:hypothetical protein